MTKKSCHKGGIDYSKWDSLNFSDSEEEEDDDYEEGRGLPRVTRLDSPSQVTTTADGTVEIHSSSSNNLKIPNNNNDNDNDKNCNNKNCNNNNNADDDDYSYSHPDKLLLKGEEVVVTPIISDDWTKNGNSFTDFQFNNPIETYWCQDRYEVILTLIIVDSLLLLENNNNHPPLSSRNAQVKVNNNGSLLVPYSDRFSAIAPSSTSTEKTVLTVSSKGSDDLNPKEHIIFQGDLAYPVHSAEDEEGVVEWEIMSSKSKKKTLSTKIIRITFRKAVPMQGLTIWWAHPLMHFPKIHVQNDILGRKNEENEHSSSSTNNKDMKKVWDEAHSMFLEKMKNKREKANSQQG